MKTIPLFDRFVVMVVSTDTAFLCCHQTLARLAGLLDTLMLILTIVTYVHMFSWQKTLFFRIILTFLVPKSIQWTYSSIKRRTCLMRNHIILTWISIKRYPSVLKCIAFWNVIWCLARICLFVLILRWLYAILLLRRLLKLFTVIISF